MRVLIFFYPALMLFKYNTFHIYYTEKPHPFLFAIIVWFSYYLYKHSIYCTTYLLLLEMQAKWSTNADLLLQVQTLVVHFCFYLLWSTSLYMMHCSGSDILTLPLSALVLYIVCTARQIVNHKLSSECLRDMILF